MSASAIASEAGMSIKDLFASDVTRDISPVVYFHEQDARRLKDEVDEYIITGGFPEGHPRAQRLKHGIHEQFVRLLRAITNELAKKGGPELPASWISGFYGSGKSSFAKLLGLALDGRALPDGRSLAAALLARDDSPRAHEFVEAWQALTRGIDPVGVVFDIGGVARDGEHIHTAVARQIQLRLGYSPHSQVADYEVKLEQDALWERFVEAAQTTLGRPWADAAREQLADEHMSHVLHVMAPERFPETMSWLDARAGATHSIGTSVEETTRLITAMMDRRAKGKTLFVVVDEVSQYVHDDKERMLKVQSFVSELGKALKGRVWLLATGQQKLEEASEDTNLGKLKERFPAALRVHLSATNIRDVVHRRLLKKTPEAETFLRDAFQKHRADLKLNAFGCDEITEEDFVEVYPMLPGHVDLLLRITTALRARSTRMQGDDHAIRGLLQLLGEIFRTQHLADAPVGQLVTLDAVFEVQHTALDPDVQTTLARVFDHPAVRAEALLARVAKAVALLENIQDTDPTTAALVAKVLYDRLGQGGTQARVTEALEKLKTENLLGYSEKQGYKIQSSAGQEWVREREDLPLTGEHVSALVASTLKSLVEAAETAKLGTMPFKWAAWYSDARRSKDTRIVDPRTDAVMAVDFRFVSDTERRQTEWVRLSDEGDLRNRVLWVVGDHQVVDSKAREYGRSEAMHRKYAERRTSLSSGKLRLLIEEEGRKETLQGELTKAVEQAFMAGRLYFRGRELTPGELAAAFSTSLVAVGQKLLPELFSSFTPIAITPAEFSQLLEPTLSGSSVKFGDQGLGILSLDAGKSIPSCHGPVPSGILRFIESEKGTSGALLLSHFGRPPYGYPVDVVRACVAGLLRAGRIRIRPQTGSLITSVRDEGARDVFNDRSLRLAELFLTENPPVNPRDRVAIARFFKAQLGCEVEPENDAIAEAVFAQFPGQRSVLREIESRYQRLPGRPDLPGALDRLGKALEESMRSRQVEDIVVATKQHLDTLRDGIEQLGIVRAELTDEAIALLTRAAHTLSHHAAQLEEIGANSDELAADTRSLTDHLTMDRPWKEIRSLEEPMARITRTYVEARRTLLASQAALVENARARFKAHPSFFQLTGDESHRVLRPFTEALLDTTAEAVAPALADLHDRFVGRLANATETAQEALDEILDRKNEKPVVKVMTHLSGREITTEEQLQALLDDLEERIRSQLADGKRVRLG